jgi:hypothetical protein
MEYSYTDIEAHIREAKKLRSEALGEILSAGYTKTVQWFKVLAQHQLHKHSIATSSSAKAMS